MIFTAPLPRIWTSASEIAVAPEPALRCRAAALLPAHGRLIFDFELALSDSRFTDHDPAGDAIPGAIDRVFAAAYRYASRLPGEPLEGVTDRHVHPLEPRAVRAYVTWKF